MNGSRLIWTTFIDVGFPWRCRRRTVCGTRDPRHANGLQGRLKQAWSKICRKKQNTQISLHLSSAWKSASGYQHLNSFSGWACSPRAACKRLSHATYSVPCALFLIKQSCRHFLAFLMYFWGWQVTRQDSRTVVSATIGTALPIISLQTTNIIANAMYNAVTTYHSEQWQIFSF